MANRALAVQRTGINYPAVAGQHTIIIGLANYRVRIIGMEINAEGAVNVTLQDEHTALFDMHLQAGGSITLPESKAGWMDAVSGDDVVLDVGAGVSIGGRIIYCMVPDNWD
jgi:hypothetical protein